MSKCVDYTKDGACSQCGGCCSAHLPITKQELKALKRWAKKHHYKPPQVEAGFNMTCPFLDIATTRCVCYDVRPGICKDFICSNAEDEKLKHKYRKATVHDLRSEIFNEDTLPIAHAQALISYLEGRFKNE